MDLATSNNLTDIQTPSRKNIGPPVLESESSMKSMPGGGKAFNKSQIPYDNDISPAVHDRSDDIVNLDIDPR